MKILHLADDEKFIDLAIKTFEVAAPDQNDLYVYSRHPLRLVKSRASIPSKLSLLTGYLAKKINQYDLVIIHSLNPAWYPSILKLNRNIPIVWIGWGYDYYDIIYSSPKQMLLPLTKQRMKEIQTTGSLYSKIKSKLKNLITSTSKTKVIERINYFSPVLPAEFDLVKNMFSGTKFPEYIFWNYGNLEEDLVRGFTDSQVTGNAILVGNSASLENNHLDTFSLLSNTGFQKRFLVCPLSYGDARYRDLLTKIGRDRFGELFKPLVDFVPIDLYVRTLESCGFVIMNHVRQQAVGNIVIMLYLGAKVFLRRECPTFEFFHSQGAIIFSVQQLEQNPDLLNAKLDQQSMKINRSIVMKNWSKASSDKKTMDLINKVTMPSLTI
ncbi:TDP-N-acetylfucosamine:lipid II N-acetylfucosaminyltransferase [Pseudomonas gregormendelii]|uniref:TDP-N-acetylfucosamine:lipid II N-acetylfucosaminyltransferase n=1 Tax=Pseudomonas gregormendelii TaxID=1628277 RepID=A0ABS3AJG6_9PSED|nr:TDP-N-acetylfucosamine:lipid II N-acetylfucosaminyltransferase [Pseudomonas gregormendelii]MBN3966971.1 TDP-N-acetylfucosamine:lipid II N-acetylfucosaminyltransferase [Pseudomonas gregormendelii]